MENKHKHLEFIQAVIARLSRSSFFVRGWTVTVFTVTLALTTTRDGHSYLATYSILPLMYFWWLDGYYSIRRRRFRDLYDKVRQLNEEEIDFSMKTEIRATVKNKLVREFSFDWFLFLSMINLSVSMFHFPLVVVMFIHSIYVSL